MASWVFCNRCFQPPCRTSRFSLTSCGHVYCEHCLSKGKKDECLICKVPCHTVLLSRQTEASIQELFLGIDSLCKKYSRETSQISEFQEKHRKRLLAFYREKITRLEESLRKSALRVEQLQSMRSSQHTTLGLMRSPVSTPSATPSRRLRLPLSSPASERVEPMDVDLTPSPMRRPELVAGPPRISLISPPQGGRMGSVSRQGSQQLSLTPRQAGLPQALRLSPLQIPCWGSSQSLGPQAAGRAGGGGLPNLASSLAPAPRPPISISGLLQRQQLGKCPRLPWKVRVTHLRCESPKSAQEQQLGARAGNSQEHGLQADPLVWATEGGRATAARCLVLGVSGAQFLICNLPVPLSHMRTVAGVWTQLQSSCYTDLQRPPSGTCEFSCSLCAVVDSQPQGQHSAVERSPRSPTTSQSRAVPWSVQQTPKCGSSGRLVLLRPPALGPLTVWDPLQRHTAHAHSRLESTKVLSHPRL
ncbi:probable E3 SUMO-protein ligase RNF212 [Saccopteryx leptura]|uniref:probable E3 SUMO-protein ligase RNF212 n=1 Tax=Saccopteryx leptura TaxID=249018 RepID=UPI00339D143D